MTYTTERTILLSFLHSNCDDEFKDLIISTFPDYMPRKGVGFIAVDNIPLAEKILLDFISEDSFQNYYINCPSGNFFQFESGSPISYGRLYIHNIKDFMISLINNDIKIFDYHFEEYDSYYS